MGENCSNKLYYDEKDKKKHEIIIKRAKMVKAALLKCHSILKKTLNKKFKSV